VAASSRYRSLQPITVVCPRCLNPLPGIAVAVETEARDRRKVSLRVRVQELDAEWWRLARRGHPNCLPDDPRKIKRLGGGPATEGFEVIDG
jgi:hypothetical protein